MNNKYETVSNKIRDLVPRLKELGESEIESLSQAHMSGYHSCCKRDSSYSCARNYAISNERDEINLEDVLEAIAKSQDMTYCAIMLGHGVMIKEYGSSGSGVLLEYGKPLSEQSEEVWDFIDNLLK